jgi:transposase-like protein
MVLEGGGDHPARRAAINSVTAKTSCTTETLRKWVRQAKCDGGGRPGPRTAERERTKVLEREVRALCQANEMLSKASAYFAQPELDRRSET